MKKHAGNPKASKPKKRKPVGLNGRKGAFSGHKTIEQIAKDQGIELRPWTDEDFERMRKLGRELFRSHKEREEFFAGIEERRRRSRGG